MPICLTYSVGADPNPTHGGAAKILDWLDSDPSQAVEAPIDADDNAGGD